MTTDVNENPEDMKESQLAVIVRDSGLDQTKADFLLKRFTEYFEVADEWEKRARSIVITNANCETQQGKFDMQAARNGRLFLRDKRIAVEKARKELKEQSLREGKAIDGIANVLKALIVPIEDYLESQEKFVEIKFEREQAIKRAEIERRIEEERIAEEKKLEADRIAEEKRIREENEQLRAEAKKRDEELITAAKIAQKEREEAARIARIALDKADAKRHEAEQEARIERDNARREREALEARLAAQVTCPKCGNVFVPGEILR